MPRVVDHDQRRLEIARVVEGLVYKGGIEALTIRDVARETGCSTSVVSHYFRSKLEMLVFTHREARRRAELALLEAFERGKDIVSCLELLLPTSEERRRDWHTWFAFWGMAPQVPQVAQEHIEGVSGARNIFAYLVEKAQQAGQVDGMADPEALTTEIQIVINGIASAVTQDARSWPPKRQKAMLRSMLGRAFDPKS